MRVRWMMSAIIALGCIKALGQYFPKASLDLRGDEFKSHWYSSQLKALKEPSLISSTKAHSSESYRFLWLRTFHHPIAIRLDINPDGIGLLTKKVASGAGCYAPGVLTENSSRALSREQTQNFLFQIDKSKFWTTPNPVDDQRGTDGSQWTIEGVKGSHYHVVDRWMPKDGAAYDLGILLVFGLGELKIPKNEIY